MHIRSVQLLVFFCLSMACSGKRLGSTENVTSTDITSGEVRYARKFDLQSFENYFELQVFSPFADSDDTLYYALKKSSCQKVFPEAYHQIDIPIQSAAILSSSHAALFKPFEAADVVTGIANIDYIYDDDIYDNYKSGHTIQVGLGKNLNYELLLSRSPDILMISSNAASEYNELQTIKRGGTGVIVNAEWREKHPLGRAEWVKVLGALLDQPEKAEAYFRKVEKNYLGLRQKALEASDQPEVLVNAPFKDSWWIPGSETYVARLLFDAGANYPWQDEQQENILQLDLESVMNESIDAAYWINPGTARSLEELAAKDSRLIEFQAFRQKRVYNHTKKINERGGNDYFETGVIRPDLVLADLIHIFHPRLLEDHTFEYYENLK